MPAPWERNWATANGAPAPWERKWSVPDTPKPSMLERAGSAAGSAIDKAGEFLFGSTKKRTAADEIHGVANPYRQSPSLEDGLFTMPVAGAVKAIKGMGKIAQARVGMAPEPNYTASDVANLNVRPYKTRGERFGESVSEVIEGGMEAGLPFLPGAFVKAPIQTALTLGSGILSAEGTRAGLEKMGVSPEYARLGGNVAGLGVGGYFGHKTGQLVEDVKGLSRIFKEDFTALPGSVGPAPKPTPGRYTGPAYLRNRTKPASTAADSAKVFEEFGKGPIKEAPGTSYEDLFDQAEKRIAQRARTEPEVPQQGATDREQRVVAQRDELAKLLGNGKSFSDLPAAEQNVINDLISEGHLSAPAQPKSADLPVVPESNATIQEQMIQLQGGQRKVVMIPKGTKAPNVPKKSGLSIVYDGKAQYIFDPKTITPREIRSAIKRDDLPSILGAKDGGMGGPNKAALESEPVAVVGKTPEGVTTQGTLTDEANLARTVEQTAKVTPEAGRVEVVPPEMEIAERLQDQAESAEIKGTIVSEPIPSEEVIQPAPVELSAEEKLTRVKSTANQIVQQVKETNGEVTAKLEGFSPEQMRVFADTAAEAGVHLSGHGRDYLFRPMPKETPSAIERTTDTPDPLVVDGQPPQPNSPQELSPLAVSPERQQTQGGFLNLGGRKPAPQTPAEIIVEKNVAAQEAAREGQKPSLGQRLIDKLRGVKATTIDSTAPIVDRLSAAQKKYGYEVLPENNIDIQINRVLRSGTLAERFLEDEGLMNIIRGVENEKAFQQYLIARHAQALGERAGRNLAEDQVIITGLENKPAYQRQPQKGPPPTYKQIADQVTQYSRRLLDYGVESGLIHPDLATKAKTMYPDYVPMQRIFASEELSAGAWSSSAVASLSKQSLVQKLQGSERQVEGPLASLISKTYDAIAQGERNKAGRMLADYRDLPGWEGLIRELGPGEHADANTTFSYLDQGKKRTFVTTHEIAAAAKSLDVKQLGAVIKAMRIFSRALTLGATGLNIPFAFTNMVKDVSATIVTAGGKTASPKAIWQGLKGAATHGDVYKQMQREGSGFTSFDINRLPPQERIDHIRAGRSVGARAEYSLRHPIRTAESLFRTAEDIMGRSEEFSRIRIYTAAYDRFKKAGRSERHASMLAAHEANFKLPPYIRRGSGMSELNAIVPFLGARTQGSRSLARAAKDNPGAVAFRLGLMSVATAAITAYTLSDEKRKSVFSDIAEYEKRGNLIWISPNPNKDEKGNYEVIKIPLAPDVGRLMHPIQRAVEQWAGLYPVEWKEVVQDLIGSVSPITPDTPASMAVEVMPQVFKAPAQGIANYDFFRDRPIVPRSLDRLVPEDQVYPWTSGTARKIGGAIGASPIKVEQFIKDVLAGVGSQGLWASDKMLEATGNIPSDQVGGIDPLSGTEARFRSAHGGEIENRKRKDKDALRLKLIRGLRNGEDMIQTFQDAYRSNLLTPAEAKAIRAESRATPELRQKRREAKERKLKK